MIERYEVIVCGGGMVGAATACALAHGGIKVALLERFNPERQWPPEPIDIRVSALTKASQNILEMVGAWPGMVQRGVCAYRDMRVWDARADGELHFDCADTEFNELGHLVENRVTVAALWDVLDSLPSATCITPAKVVDMQLNESSRQLRLEDGRILEADLVIAADGRDSTLRAMAGIDVTGWDYHQDGLVATVSTEKSHQFTAWQRFLDEGPLAFFAAEKRTVFDCLDPELGNIKKPSGACRSRLPASSGTSFRRHSWQDAGRRPPRRISFTLSIRKQLCRPTFRAMRRCRPCHASSGRTRRECRAVGCRSDCGAGNPDPTGKKDRYPAHVTCVVMSAGVKAIT